MLKITLLIISLILTQLFVVKADAPLKTSSFIATAYSLRGKTASGKDTRKGIIAADPRVLPLGTRVRIEDSPYSGEYVVADTGGGIKGNRIDIWVSSHSEAIKFGRRKVKLTILRS